MKKALVINPKDNVAVALDDIKKGESVELVGTGSKCAIVSSEKIPFAHKIALKDIGKGEDIIKYGEKIGFATENIKQGDMVHTHNVSCERGRKRDESK